MVVFISLLQNAVQEVLVLMHLVHHRLAQLGDECTRLGCQIEPQYIKTLEVL